MPHTPCNLHCQSLLAGLNSGGYEQYRDLSELVGQGDKRGSVGQLQIQKVASLEAKAKEPEAFLQEIQKLLKLAKENLAKMQHKNLHGLQRSNQNFIEFVS